MDTGGAADRQCDTSEREEEEMRLAAAGPDEEENRRAWEEEEEEEDRSNDDRGTGEPWDTAPSHDLRSTSPPTIPTRKLPRIIEVS